MSLNPQREAPEDDAYTDEKDAYPDEKDAYPDEKIELDPQTEEYVDQALQLYFEELTKKPISPNLFVLLKELEQIEAADDE